MKRRLHVRNSQRPNGYVPRQVPRNGVAAVKPNWAIRNVATAPGSPTATDLFIYDEIGWFGIMAQDVVRALLSCDTDQINVRINSPGGDVFDGIAIMNALLSHSATINVVVDSLCASIATVIAMAGDTITMAPGSQMMIHNASGLCIGDADDMRSLADMLDFQTANIAGVYTQRAGGAAADWLTAMADETWFGAQEAVAAGLADACGVIPQGGTQIEAPSANELMPPDGSEDAWDLSVFKFAGRDHAPAPKIAARAEKIPENIPATELAAFQAKAQSKLDMRLGEVRVDAARHGMSPEQIDALIEDKSKTMQWDWQTDGDANVCDICQGNADGGPYKPGDQPDCPAHPNCGCELTPIMVVTFDDHTPQAPAAPASPVIPIDADLFRRTLEGAFV